MYATPLQVQTPHLESEKVGQRCLSIPVTVQLLLCAFAAAAFQLRLAHASPRPKEKQVHLRGVERASAGGHSECAILAPCEPSFLHVSLASL